MVQNTATIADESHFLIDRVAVGCGRQASSGRLGYGQSTLHRCTSYRSVLAANPSVARVHAPSQPCHAPMCVLMWILRAAEQVVAKGWSLCIYQVHCLWQTTQRMSRFVSKPFAIAFFITLLHVVYSSPYCFCSQILADYGMLASWASCSCAVHLCNCGNATLSSSTNSLSSINRPIKVLKEPSSASTGSSSH